MDSIVISKGNVKRIGAKILILFFCLHLASLVFAQNVSLSLSNEPIEKAFASIEAQTAFSFIYSTEAIKKAKPLTLQLTNIPFREALAKIFYGQPLHYAIDDQKIIVKAVQMKAGTEKAVLRGKVMNEEGEPLPGVNIIVKGSQLTSVSDDKGNFQLTGLNEGEILSFSMVGYKNVELPYTNQQFVQVIMQIEVAILDETIIKGYYNTTRRLNTGSVDKVSGEKISRQPVSNVLAALEGNVPGLLITQQNGLPGSNFSILIRGRNSIQSGTSPLYIIDGVPFLNDADLLTQLSGINANNPLNTINPADIESIEVLKDADATAIYGSRGANGVILITTRKAKDTKTTFNLNVYQGWSRITHLQPYMNTRQYLEMRHEALRNDNEIPNSSNAFDFLVWDSTRYTDFGKLLIGNTASAGNYNLRISGGTTATRFSLGAGYNRQTTVFPGNNSDKRTSLDFRLEHSLPAKKFKLSLATGYSSEASNLPNLDLTQFINLPPTLPDLYDSSGRLNWSEGGFSFFNPLSVTRQTYAVNTGRLTSNLDLAYALSRNIDLKASFGYNEVNSDENSRFPIASQDPAFAPTGSSFFGNSHFKNWLVEPQAEFHSLIGKKGKLQYLIGASFQVNHVKRTAISAKGYTDDALLESIAAASNVTTKNSGTLYRYNAIFTRLNYTYNQKYIINLTGRRDGSSRFGPGRQFANFGAIGWAWIFTSEKWLGTHLPFISFGKLRGSYGITGNDLIGDYQYLDTYKFTLYPYQGDASLFPQKLFNPLYSWEQIRKLDAAIELNIFRDRVNLQVDYFDNKSRNQIINYSLPGQAGFSTVLQNFPGVVQNKGVEVELGAKIIQTQSFSWHSSFQLTKSQNRLVAFPDLSTSSYWKRYTIGKPLNSSIGYLFAGVDPQTGVYQFFDQSKNLTASPTIDDYTYLGTTDPDFYGSWSHDISSGLWTLGFSVEFRKQLGMSPFYQFGVVGVNQNEPVYFLNRWQRPGDIASIERFTQTFGPVATAAQYVSNSSALLTDASFIRLKTMFLSFDLPSACLQRLKMETARFFIEGQNLLLITKFKGSDPETQNPLNLPPLKTLAVGVQLTF